MSKCAAEQYIQDVLSGKQVAGQLMVKACRRHQRDLERTDICFDPDAGQRVIEFIQTFCIPPNQTAPMQLLPWQQAILYIVFGWKNLDGYRRFRRVYCEVAKKSGKTGFLAALSLYMLIADAERSARCFIAATTRQQARQCFTEAILMRKHSPELCEAIQQSGGKTDDKSVMALYVSETGSRLSTMARDAASEDGAVLSFACIDEFHRWKTGSNLWSLLRYGGDTRKQPLLWIITTAGSSSGSTSLCWNEREYGCKVLDGVIEDDELAPFIFSLDPKDDFKDPANWIKSNPSLGVLISVETLLNQFNEAQGKPSSMSEYKRFRLNIWSEDAAEPAIELSAWDACCRSDATYPDPKALRLESLEELRGRQCYAGMDLAPKGDTSCLVLAFTPPDNTQPWRIVSFFWVPAGNIEDRVKRDRVPYDRWHELGFLKATGGDITDVRTIARDIVQISKDYDIQQLAYDRNFSEELVRMLEEEGYDMERWVQFPQSALKMNSPSQELMRKILRKELTHDADPVARWQISNLRWATVPATGFIRPSKDRIREKVDYCSALIMAIGVAAEAPAPPPELWVVTSQ